MHTLHKFKPLNTQHQLLSVHQCHITLADSCRLDSLLGLQGNSVVSGKNNMLALCGHRCVQLYLYLYSYCISTLPDAHTQHRWPGRSTVPSKFKTHLPVLHSIQLLKTVEGSSSQTPSLYHHTAKFLSSLNPCK